MHRDAFALGHQLAVAIEDSGGKIPAGVEYLGHGRAQHRLGHLLSDGLQPVLDHCHGDRVVVRGAVRSVGPGGTGRCGLYARGDLLAHLQLHSTHGVDRGAVSGPHQDGGEFRFQDRRAGNFRARGQLVRGVDLRFAPVLQVDAARADRCCLVPAHHLV